jgi:uncharacterized protein YdcH (DUF465 family)
MNLENPNISFSNESDDDWVPDFSTDGPSLAKPIEAKFTNQDYKNQLSALETNEMQFHQRFQQYKQFNPESESTHTEIKNLNNMNESEMEQEDLISGVGNWKKYYEQDDMEILYDPVHDIKLEDRYNK